MNEKNEPARTFVSFCFLEGDSGRRLGVACFLRDFLQKSLSNPDFTVRSGAFYPLYYRPNYSFD